MRCGDTAVVFVWFQTEVLQESMMMIHDSHRRLVTAHGNLLHVLVSNAVQTGIFLTAPTRAPAPLLPQQKETHL